MSYTRPAASAADLSWAGQPAYTRPSAAAADLNFFTALTATGFAPVRFGFPSLPLPVTGLAPVHFGTPLFVRTATSLRPVHFGTPLFLRVDGFAPVHFGRPLFGRPVTGFAPVHIGTPVFNPLRRVLSLRAVHFGQVTFPHLVEGPVTGWRAGNVGRPTNVRWLPPVNRRLGTVTRLRPVHFGHPTL